MGNAESIAMYLVLSFLVIRTAQQAIGCADWEFPTRNANYPKCIACFCNDVTTRCRRAMYFAAKLELQDVSRVKAIAGDIRLPDNAIYYTASNEVILGDIDKLGSPVVYWILPVEFLGNQVFSYGGYLEYTVFYDVLTRSAPYLASDVILKGLNGQTIIYKKEQQLYPKITKEISLRIAEENFHLENGRKASRKDVMRVLLNIKQFLIRATYAADTKVTLINSVSLGTATPYYTRYGRAQFIEHCLCPQGYHGFSCEACQRGYTRLESSTSEKRCIRCNCNRHSLECHPENGICKNCQDNTMGDHCQTCKPGYYGDATKGTTGDCQRCACPLASNQFSPTCEQMINGLVKCTACREGYTGIDCGECAEGFAGNPRFPGGKCIRTFRRADRLPRIHVKPRSRTDPLRYRATFRCEVVGAGPFHVTWSRKDARPLPVGRSRVLSRNKEWILIISSLRIEDEGDYVCSARSHYGIASYKVNMKIYEHQGPAIKVSVTPRSLRIAEGSSALFLCTVNTILLTYTRSWSRDGYRLLPGSADVVDGTLSFHNAKREDTGVYACSASNQISVDSATVVLSVGALITPQLSLWPLTQTVDIGYSVRFQCTAAGFPRPEIFWSKEEDSRDEENRYSYSSNGVLSLENARVDDEGEYKCTARNKGGEVSRRAILYVRAPNRKLAISIYPQNIKAEIGEKATFKCASSGHPEPAIRWSFRKGQDVKVHDGTMTFSAVKREDTGVYVCTASNPYGSVSAKVKLNVISRSTGMLNAFMNPETLTIEEGQSALLKCNVTGTFSMLIWSRGDGLLSDNHIINNYQLNITKATIKDQGTYVCIATNKGMVARASANVFVQRNIPPKVVIHPNTYRNASVGDNINFRCTVVDGHPVAHVIWYKGNGVVLVNGKANANRTSDLLLSFNSVKKQDEGMYSCATVNKAGFSKKTAILKVSGRPSIDLSPRGFYNASNGDDLIFECKANGYPVPKVEWILPTLNATGRTSVTSWPGYARIEMKASANVAGKYICKAANKEGEKLDWVFIAVRNISLKPLVKVEQTVIHAVAGEQVKIKCEPTGIPTPEFAWMKIRKNARSIALSKRNVLIFDDVRVSHEGTYGCRAWNHFGMAETTSVLKVSTPPVMEVSTTSIVVLSGRSFNLDCKATGYPVPIVNWTREVEDNYAAYTIRDGKLEVAVAVSEHNGKYACIAKNDGGTVTKTVNVTVLLPPKILSSSKQENIAKLGEKTMFFCNVSGYPVPRLQWMKDDTLILNANGPTLRLKNLTSESQGQYKCIASNLAGQAEEIFSLAIEEIPTANILEDAGTGLKVVPVGKNITLNCISSGSPEPVIRWTKTKGRLPNGFIVEGGRLKIVNSSVEDSGTFRCSAFNPVGHVHSEMRIFVQGAPVVQVRPKSIQVQVGKETRISCLATGLPQPSITWKKVGGSMPPHFIEKNQLIIPKVGSIDGGEYICRASNTRGTSEELLTLRVTDFLPRFCEDGLSYIIYDKISGALYQTKVEISFRPENEDGILLYNGQSDGDFLSLGIQQGYIIFQYNLGSGPAFIKSQRKIDLFKWHNVIAYRDGLDGTLSVDNDPIIYGKSKGKYTGLNLNGDLFLGGHPNLNVIKKQALHSRGFAGCVSQMKISEKAFQMGEDSLMMVGISDCNICLTQPCKSNGICLPSATRFGYRCECQPGFTGINCKKRVARCFPGACGLDGVCTDTESSEFKCKCPIGAFGPRCQLGKLITTPSFVNDSFLTFPGIKGAWEELYISIKFKPRSENGLVLFNGGVTSPNLSGSSYILIHLVAGYVRFEFDSGTGPAVIKYEDKISLDKWNTVEVERYRRFGSISVDGKVAKKGTSQGDSIALNLGNLLYVEGGHLAVENFLNRSRWVGFDGCIQELIVNGKTVDMVRDFSSSKGVMDCQSNVTPCAPNLCLNNGSCQVVSALTYKCICPLKYYGEHCESFTSRCGDVDECENGGTCVRSLQDKYSCRCKLGFTGRGCERAIKIRKEALFKGDGFLQFPRHLLRKIELTSLQFDLKTKEERCLIFWFGEEKVGSKGRNPDFLSIGLKSGFLEASYELGSGLAVILTKQPVNDGNWHTIKMNRSARNASLFIDGTKVAETQSQGINTNLDIEAPMFFGGGNDVASLTGQKYKKSFAGCIANVFIEGQAILLQDMAEDGRSVHPCTENSV